MGFHKHSFQYSHGNFSELNMAYKASNFHETTSYVVYYRTSPKLFPSHKNCNRRAGIAFLLRANDWYHVAVHQRKPLSRVEVDSGPPFIYGLLSGGADAPSATVFLHHPGQLDATTFHIRGRFF